MDIGYSPFEVLGIEETTNRIEIMCAYKHMLLLYHPDKNNINLPKKEKENVVRRVRDAYKTIMRDHIFYDCPDYDLEYQFENFEIVDRPKNEFDLKKFNENFEKRKKDDIDNNMLNPYEFQGYNEFNRDPDHEKTRKQKINPKSPTFKKSKEEKIIIPLSKSSSHYELGLINVGDYSMETRCKNSLKGNDLMTAFNDPENLNIEVKEVPLEDALEKMKKIRETSKYKFDGQEKKEEYQHIKIQRERDQYFKRAYSRITN